MSLAAGEGFVEAGVIPPPLKGILHTALTARLLRPTEMTNPRSCLVDSKYVVFKYVSKHTQSTGGRGV